jgi:hypothetical protein
MLMTIHFSRFELRRNAAFARLPTEKICRHLHRRNICHGAASTMSTLPLQRRTHRTLYQARIAGVQRWDPRVLVDTTGLQLGWVADFYILFDGR